MKTCPTCGRVYSDMVGVCPVCKTSLNSGRSASYPPAPTPRPTPTPAPTPASAKEEGSCFGWSVLGFFIPIVGLILYFCWKNEKPKAAKASLHGFFAYLIIVALYILLMVCVLSAH